MPSLTPVSETQETLSLVSEQAETLAALAADYSLYPAAPNAYPSGETYPGVVADVALFLTVLQES